MHRTFFERFYMNKLIALSLVASIVSLSADTPQPGTPEFFAQTNAAKNIPQQKPTLSVEEALKKPDLINPFAATVKKDSVRKTMTFKRLHATNEIVIQLTGIETDNLSVSNETGTTADINIIVVEDMDKKIAEISIIKKSECDYPKKFYTGLESKSPDIYQLSIVFEKGQGGFPIIGEESLIGSLGYLRETRVNYSKDEQAVTITIPFTFSRKSLPVTIK